MPFRRPAAAAAAAALALALLAGGNAQALTVPGSANPKLAGMPDGITASCGDVAPSPVLFALGSPTIVGLSFSVTGAANFVPDPAPAGQGPDGFASVGATNGAENAKCGMNLPTSPLVGVFPDANQPDGAPAPATPDFSSSASRDFRTLSPLHKQVFFVGDGMTAGGALQVSDVATGATRQFRGSADGFGWFSNSGAFDVTVRPIVSDPNPVPLPGALALFGAGLLGVAGARRAATAR